jgi:hypothetical protein
VNDWNHGILDEAKVGRLASAVWLSPVKWEH